MTYKRRETMREIRLWICQIVVPIVTLATTTLAIPEVRQAAKAKAKEVKYNIDRKLKKD